MAVSAGDVLRITAKMSLAGGDLQNVFHVFNYGAGEDNATVFAALAALVDDAYDLIADEFDTSLQFETIHIVNLTAEELVGEEAWPTLTAGLDTSGILPQQLAPLVLFSTSTLRSQGRKYLPATAYNTLTNTGVLFGTTYTSIAFWAASFLAGVTAGSASFVFGNFNTGTGVFSTWIGAIVESIFRTQRRRVPGVGS